MKKRICYCLFGMILAIPYVLTAQTANIQFIHNMADSTLDSVTVYVGGLPLPPLKYEGATPFQPFTVANPLVIAVAPGNSITATETAGIPVTLKDLDPVLGAPEESVVPIGESGWKRSVASIRGGC